MDTYLVVSVAKMVREAEQLGARAREASSTSSREEGADLDTSGWLDMTLCVVCCSEIESTVLFSDEDLIDHEHSASTG